MKSLASPGKTEIAQAAIALDDIPTVVVLLFPDGDSFANLEFFRLTGVVADGVVSRQAPRDLVRQLVGVRDGKNSHTLLTVSANAPLTLRLVSWNIKADESACVFVMNVESVPQQVPELNDICSALGAAEEILNTLPLAVFVHDAGRLLYGNLALARLGGFSDIQSMLESDLNAFDFFPKGKRMREFWARRARRLSALTTYETELVTLDGERRVVKVNAKNMNWNGRNIAVGSVSDITDALLAEQELAESEARFKDYANTAANWFWETDAEDRYVRLSDGLTEITGTVAKDILGLRRAEVFDLWQGEYVDCSEQHATALTQREPFRDVKYALIVPDGRRISVSISGVPIYGSQGEFAGYRGTSRDITEERKLQEAINYYASHDDLTGLLNRRILVERVDEAIVNATNRSERDKTGRYDFLCYIDLDGLKVINDTMGHGFGDELLIQCSTLLKKGVRDGEIVARLGGDEFGILLRRITREGAVSTIERLLNQVSSYKFHRQNQTFNVGFSAGLICIDGRVSCSEDLFTFADTACYTAKERGKGQVCVYETSDVLVKERQVEMHMASRIESAIDNQRLVIHAQPIVSLTSDSHAPEHYELLVRMVNEDGSLIPPGAFIGAAERYNLAPRIDRFVLHNAFVKIAPYVRDGGTNIPRITVNLSGETLGDASFAKFVTDELVAFPDIAPSLVCFEITETAAIQNLDVASDFIDRMRRLGCLFALDDFGTGLSSFSYLKDLDVDFLKVDGSFIDDIVNDPINRAVVASICEIARSLDRKVVAECVEDSATVNMLTALGVDYGQGFIWGHPRPLDDVLEEHQRASQMPVDEHAMARRASVSGATREAAETLPTKPSPAKLSEKVGDDEGEQSGNS